VAHRRAKLTVLCRRLPLERITVDGMAVAHAAHMAGVSRQTATKWVRRFEAEGDAGLEDRLVLCQPGAANARRPTAAGGQRVMRRR
jgi:transposase